MTTSPNTATFESLPVELKIAIIEELYKPTHWPENAAWAKPYRAIHDGREEKGEYVTVDTPVDISDDLLFTVPSGSDLRSLRQVSSELNSLCVSFLHQELDIYDSQLFIPRSNCDVTCSINPEHVRSIRIHLGADYSMNYLNFKVPGSSEEPSVWAVLLESIALVLSQCTHVTKLAIYYASGQDLAQATVLIDQLARMLEGGSIRHFGIYSTIFMGHVRYLSAWDSQIVPAARIQALFNTRDRCKSLRRVELVMNKIEHTEYELVQQNLSSVESLTILRASRRYHGDIDLSFGVNKWKANPNLTRLHLAHCEPAHVQNILDLVRHFPSLQELLWDISGHYSDRRLPAPEPGWSQMPTALHNIRKPLRLLHLEHVIEWELAVLSQIPAVEVVVAHYEVYRIGNVLSSTRENFIGMQVLRVSPLDESDDSLSSKLEEECRARDAILSYDAEIHFPCSCCYNPV
ncbi:hypothetical protein FRC19_009278 [Serendipita sp. 401]|nr:hypothetical protein FRC19_009278 [Serendipita sp. 401]KAG9057057.1 hypothetical protein FS842_008719 [Serendipita sp. 407]